MQMQNRRPPGTEALSDFLADMRKESGSRQPPSGDQQTLSHIERLLAETPPDTPGFEQAFDWFDRAVRGQQGTPSLSHLIAKIKKVQSDAANSQK